jgi:hypothetical protein
VRAKAAVSRFEFSGFPGALSAYGCEEADDFLTDYAPVAEGS